MKVKPKTQTRQKSSGSQIGDIDSYLGYWLRFVSNQVTASFQQRLLEKEITVAEWIALRFLHSHAPCSLTKLAEEMGMDKGAVSRLTDRLEKRELIKRNVSQKDRRLFSIELTLLGQKTVPILSKIADENDHYFFGHLSKKEANQLTQVLKDIVERHEIKGRPLD
jgi:DNA-binding MarR family transcriptional regulator